MTTLKSVIDEVIRQLPNSVALIEIVTSITAETPSLLFVCKYSNSNDPLLYTIEDITSDDIVNVMMTRSYMTELCYIDVLLDRNKFLLYPEVSQAIIMNTDLKFQLNYNQITIKFNNQL